MQISLKLPLHQSAYLSQSDKGLFTQWLIRLNYAKLGIHGMEMFHKVRTKHCFIILISNCTSKLSIALFYITALSNIKRYIRIVYNCYHYYPIEYIHWRMYSKLRLKPFHVSENYLLQLFSTSNMPFSTSILSFSTSILPSSWSTHCEADASEFLEKTWRNIKKYWRNIKW